MSLQSGLGRGLDALLPGAVMHLSYTQLVTEPEETIRGLLAHCGLDFEPACLEFHASDRAVRTASSEQVRKPIYRSALEHWRHFESHLDMGGHPG